MDKLSKSAIRNRHKLSRKDQAVFFILDHLKSKSRLGTKVLIAGQRAGFGINSLRCAVAQLRRSGDIEVRRDKKRRSIWTLSKISVYELYENWEKTMKKPKNEKLAV